MPRRLLSGTTRTRSTIGASRPRAAVNRARLRADRSGRTCRTKGRAAVVLQPEFEYRDPYGASWLSGQTCCFHHLDTLALTALARPAGSSKVSAWALSMTGPRE